MDKKCYQQLPCYIVIMLLYIFLPTDHHRSDEYAHAWHPLSPRRKTPHKGHGSAKSSKSKALKAAGAKVVVVTV